jgi:hypothetical protein
MNIVSSEEKKLPDKADLRFTDENHGLSGICLRAFLIITENIVYNIYIA